MPVKALLVAERGRDFTAVRSLLAEAGLDIDLDWVTTAEAARTALAMRRHEVGFLAPRPGQRGLPGLLAWDEFGPPVALVVLTSGAGPEDEDAIMRAGASEVLDRETVSAAVLGRAVRHLLYREGRGRRLRDAVERLSVTADLTPGALVYVDRERRVIGANRRGAAWLGRPGRDVRGLRLGEFLGDDAARFEPYVDAALRGQAIDVEMTLRQSGIGPGRTRVRLMPDRAGGGFVAFIDDAPGAEDAGGRSASAERLRDLALAASEWLWETDPEHRLVYLSDGAERHIGRATERMIGRTPWQALDAEDDGANQAAADDMVAGRLLADAVVAYRDERQVARAVLLAGRPLAAADGTFLGYRGIGRDITAEVRAASAEFDALDRLAGPAVAARTRQAFGQGGLDETMPEVFAELVADYGRVLERCGDGADDRVVATLAPAIQDITQRLGFLRAGARDVVRLHRQALAERLKFAAPEPTRRMLGRSRFALIAALAQLVGHYRAGATADHGDAPLARAKR
ncbi:MAG: PAS domain-containing protein [Alphaproteobacteria bacterium]